MENIILFRGMVRTDLISQPKWIYGVLAYPFERRDTPFIMSEMNTGEWKQDGMCMGGFKRVIPETVGQLHNGLTAKAGKNVFVGDILLHDLAEGFGEPVKQNCKTIVTSVEMFTYFFTDVKVVGNIHETPEKP